MPEGCFLDNDTDFPLPWHMTRSERATLHDILRRLRPVLGNAEAGSMWGGFALAVLSADRRTGPLTVTEAQRFVFEAVREKAHL